MMRHQLALHIILQLLSLDLATSLVPQSPFSSAASPSCCARTALSLSSTTTRARPFTLNCDDDLTPQQQSQRRRIGRRWTTSTSLVSLPSLHATIEAVDGGATDTSSSLFFRDDEDAGGGSLELPDDCPSYYDPNEIHPKTKPIVESAGFFAGYCLRMIAENQRRKRLLERIRSKRKRQLEFIEKAQRLRRRKSPLARSVSTWRKLNEQRRNLVKLADYTAHIVAPSFVVLALGALMVSVIPHYYSQCIQLVATLDRSSSSRLLRALVGLTLSSVFGALFTGMRGSLFWIGGTRANYNIRVKLHRNLLLQEAAFFDSSETGYLLSRLNNDVNKIGMVISFHVNVVCRQLAQFLFGSIYLVRISPRLALQTFVGIAAVAYVSAVYGKFNRRLAEQVQDTFADATAVAETSLSMSETIRAFDGVEVESAKYETAQGRALELEEVQAWGYGTHKLVSDTLQVILQVSLLFACWRMGLAGNLPAGQLTTFMFYTNFVLESSNEVGDQWAKIQAAIGASTNVFGLIRRIPSVRDPPAARLKADQNVTSAVTVTSQRGAASAITMFEKMNGDVQPTINGVPVPAATTPLQVQPPIIEMRNMTVKYGAMDVPALDSVDLRIHEGDRVAVVGRSGSGKSSMLRSILRFYDPSDGTIEMTGRSLKQIPRRELARRVAVVEQEPSLFPMTLLENVLYGIAMDSVDPKTGEPCYSDEMRRSAAESLREAGLPVHPGNDLNLELDTRVGEGGRSLSGGQRQRVAIARALIRNPEVLLLDEPTAALDSQSEKKVVEALLRAMDHSKSMVMVTHRLGVVRSLGVNRVVVLDGGRIVESGHPEVLLADQDSLYASLAREQGITACRSLSTALINKYLHEHEHEEST